MGCTLKGFNNMKREGLTKWSREKEGQGCEVEASNIKKAQGG
jgi:hypothetical protein